MRPLKVHFCHHQGLNQDFETISYVNTLIFVFMKTSLTNTGESSDLVLTYETFATRRKAFSTFV